MKRFESISTKILTLIIVAILIGAIWFAVRAFQPRNIDASNRVQQSEPVTTRQSGASVQADGIVQAKQTAQLVWRTSGRVKLMNVSPGDVVSAGQTLAILEQSSLPQEVILARADLIAAQRELDDLLNSQTGRAEVLKAVEEAQQALEDAQDNAPAEAQAQEGKAQAQKEVEKAELNLAIVTKKPSQQAIDQAYANLLLAENVLNRTREQHEKIQRNLDKPKSNYLFFESKALYRGLLKSLDLKLANDQLAYERALERYNQLLEPVDPLDRMIAEGNLQLAQAKLDQARREWERVKDGPSQAELAVLEAQLADAQREWERWKEGADPAEIAAAQARLAAAQAVLEADRITAPFDGVVTAVWPKPGDLVESGELAFRIDNVSPLLVSLQVSEIDINRVKKDQALILRLDSAPGSEYHGRVTEVPAVAQKVEGVVSFIVKAEILDADARVRPGMTASADIAAGVPGN
jgi:HlyD family secretion protein